MLSSITRRHTLLRALRPQTRSFAEAVAIPSATNTLETPPPVVPKRRVPVNENHGLYAFFRKSVNDDGTASYETLSTNAEKGTHGGRAWKASELRHKSFKDLHTLWYVLLREKNLLATEREEHRRMTGRTSFTPDFRATQVRKSMARIKYVVNERRLAYTGAVDLLATQRAEAEALKADQKVLEYQLDAWNKERMARGRQLSAARAGKSEIHAAQVAARQERRRILRRAKVLKEEKRAEAVKVERKKIVEEITGKVSGVEDAVEAKSDSQAKKERKQQVEEERPKPSASAGLFGR
jgi:large subunit ribosomal protein L47